tara:strand:- start:351 stop:1043 length:693 start_codon:yes stop_codon:yes gene_type:complete
MKIKATINDIMVNPNSHVPDLTICKSNLKHAGSGLFSTRWIAKGQPVCEYKGEYLTAERIESGDTDYVLTLTDNPMTDLNGNLIRGIDADPHKAQEIGYGGFANDRFTHYPESLLGMERRINKTTVKMKEENRDYFMGVIGKLKKESDYKLSDKEKKKFKRIYKRQSINYDKYLNLLGELGYNCIYYRLPSAAAFILLSIKDIFPGEEIYVPYGEAYWKPRNEQETNTKD